MYALLKKNWIKDINFFFVIESSDKLDLFHSDGKKRNTYLR